MPVRLRKLVGAIALIVLVLGWVLIAMEVAQFPVLRTNAVLEAGYYAVAGLGWILPAMPLIRWAFGRRMTEHPDDGGRKTDDGSREREA
jgi:uncharacterized membrane protein YedE/YeeE